MLLSNYSGRVMQGHRDKHDCPETDVQFFEERKKSTGTTSRDGV